MANEVRATVFPYRRNWGMAGLLAFIFLAWLAFIFPYLIYVPSWRYIGLPMLAVLGFVNVSAILSSLRYWNNAPKEVEVAKKEILVRNQDGRERIIAKVNKIVNQWKWHHALVFNQGFVVEGEDPEGTKVREGFFTSDLGLEATRELDGMIRGRQKGGSR